MGKQIKAPTTLGPNVWHHDKALRDCGVRLHLALRERKNAEVAEIRAEIKNLKKEPLSGARRAKGSIASCEPKPSGMPKRYSHTDTRTQKGTNNE